MVKVIEKDKSPPRKKGEEEENETKNSQRRETEAQPHIKPAEKLSEVKKLLATGDQHRGLREHKIRTTYRPQRPQTRQNRLKRLKTAHRGRPR